MLFKNDNNHTTIDKTNQGHKHVFFQPKLTVNQPGDIYEQEADTMADQVMHMSVSSSSDSSFFKPAQSFVQRKCQHCEEEEKLHRKESSGNEVQGSNSLDNYVGSLGSSGQTLSDSSRQFFEPRFGHDFSNVRIHTDTVAAKSAESINALAYTTGNNIVFNSGQYAPESDNGKKLMAHELTHVVQQGGSVNRKIQRAVGTHTHCPANVHGAPASPLPVIQAANARAVMMSLGTSLLLFSESLFIQDATFGASSIFGFYRGRFGDPVAVGTKFRNRFNNSLHDTLLKAQASELQFLSTRLGTISHFLDGSINFKCNPTHIGSCTNNCGPNTVLASCAAGHGNEIAICDGFWGVSAPDQQAIGMIHEISHMLFHFGDHDTAPFAQSSAERRTEPECYSSLVADVYGITPFDPSCPIIV